MGQARGRHAGTTGRRSAAGCRHRHRAPLTDHLQRGAAAEDLAAAWLVRQGLTLLVRNFRSTRGELDLVMRDGDELVIVEVRCRTRPDPVHPLETITRAKCRRIVRATEDLLQGLSLWDHPLRFDVLVVSGDPPAADVEWHRAAFTADDTGRWRGH
jgi:putative endonuclease